MPSTLFKQVNYTLNKLVEDIDIGEIALPDIQRPFVWTNAKVRDLFDSMYRGFPVGYLLFWENGTSDGHRQVAASPQRSNPRLLIVDGQQRLTSLYAVFKGAPITWRDYSHSKVSIAFRPADGSFEVTSAAIRKDPEWISDISSIWAPSLSRSRFTRIFVDTLKARREQAGREFREQEEDQISDAIDRLAGLQEYPFTALELSPSIDEEQVAEVFVRVNSKGVSLNQADFILTLMSVFWDEGRTELEEFCKSATQPAAEGPSAYNLFITPEPSQLLRTSVAVGFKRARLQHVYSILRGKDLETNQFSDQRRDEQFEVLKLAQQKTLGLQDWHEFFKALMQAGYRRSQEITSEIGMLFAYSLYLIGRHDYGVDPYLLRNLIARWFFMSALTRRYTGSSETIMEEDLARFRGVEGPAAFVEILESEMRNQFTEDYWRVNLPLDLIASSARTPVILAYYAALNILDAKAFFSRVKVSEMLDPVRAPRAALERHHIFPRAYLERNGIKEDRTINQVANMALAEWSDNLDIGDKPPSEYFPQLASRLSESDLRLMMYWHALPEGWHEMEYSDFLEERRKLIAGVIRDAYNRLAR